MKLEAQGGTQSREPKGFGRGLALKTLAVTQTWLDTVFDGEGVLQRSDFRAG
jgi:hypothetical protein